MLDSETVKISDVEVTPELLDRSLLVLEDASFTSEAMFVFMKCSTLAGLVLEQSFLAAKKPW